MALTMRLRVSMSFADGNDGELCWFSDCRRAYISLSIRLWGMRQRMHVEGVLATVARLPMNDFALPIPDVE